MSEEGPARRPILAAAVNLAGAAILAIGLATSRSVAAEPEAAPSPQATEYLPSISDLMIATIQPRHERRAVPLPLRDVQSKLHDAFPICC